jgi:hypothetical protein
MRSHTLPSGAEAAEPPRCRAPGAGQGVPYRAERCGVLAGEAP